VGTSPDTILFPSPTDPSHAAIVWNDPLSGSNEAARRTNLEEAGHESNMLQEENDLTMKLDTGSVRVKGGITHSMLWRAFLRLTHIGSCA
jgi:hypothetical protein